MENWTKGLKYDAIGALVGSDNRAIEYFTRKDLLSERVPGLSRVRNLEEPRKILGKQEADGRWISKSPNRLKAPAVNYDLFETFKRFSILIDKYSFNNRNDQVRTASEFLFSCQTEEGDIRGILGNQYAPYYTGLIMSLLIKAGYSSDSRVEKGFSWLLKMRQNDGGWVIGSPGCYGTYTREESRRLTTHDEEPRRDFDRDLPFTHAGTGMVIRAFAVHPRYRRRKEARVASSLLKSQFFRKDNSSSYKHEDNWVNFKYPFFWTDLVSALDSISLIDRKVDDAMELALDWIHENQQETGLWKNTYSRIHNSKQNSATHEVSLWISLAICRILKRLLN